MSRRMSAAAVVLALCLPLVVGCRNEDSRGSKGPEVVTMVVLPYLGYAPLFIAVDEGFFAGQGLDIRVVQLGTPQMTAALARGEVDVVAQFLSAGVFNMIGRGAPARVVADKGYHDPARCPYHGLFIRSSLAEGGKIPDVPSAAGWRVEYDTGSIEEYWLEQLLASGGLTLGDVSQVVLPGGGKLEGLRGGGVDAAQLSEPLLTEAAEAGLGVLWRSVPEVLPDAEWAFVMFGEKLLDKDSDVGERWMIGYLQGVQRCREGKTDRNVAILAAHTGLSPDLVRRACWTAVREDGRIDLESIDEFQRWAVERGYLDRVLGPEEYWEPRFVERAAAALDPRGGS